MTRLFQVAHYAIIQSQKISEEKCLGKVRRIAFFFDMMKCYLLYGKYRFIYIPSSKCLYV